MALSLVWENEQGSSQMGLTGSRFSSRRFHHFTASWSDHQCFLLEVDEYDEDDEGHEEDNEDSDEDEGGDQTDEDEDEDRENGYGYACP